MSTVLRQIIDITPRAIQRIEELLQSKPQFLGIRIKVKSGGCSGLKYAIEYASTTNPLDEVVVSGNVTVFIDPTSIMRLMGSQMDYHEEQFKSGFVFSNPKEKARCGCGKSFNI